MKNRIIVIVTALIFILSLFVVVSGSKQSTVQELDGLHPCGLKQDNKKLSSIKLINNNKIKNTK